MAITLSTAKAIAVLRFNQ